MEKTDDGKSSLKRVLEFYSINLPYYGNKREIMCWKSFSPPWIQFSYHFLLIHCRGNVLKEVKTVENSIEAYSPIS